MDDRTGQDLTGQLLIAMPNMEDTRFEGAVIFMCAHSDDGSMGLIINKVSSKIAATDVFEQLDITPDPDMPPLDVCYGGPVEMARGFVLHSTDYACGDASLPVNDLFSMTASRDVLSDIAAAGGPKERLLCLGYAGWSPGQLDQEIAENAWLTCDANLQVVFHTSGPDKWTAALGLIGVNAALLSATSGRA
jgi:putative transcriptional regulator